MNPAPPATVSDWQALEKLLDRAILFRGYPERRARMLEATRRAIAQARPGRLCSGW